jgi:hypothetical protein
MRALAKCGVVLAGMAVGLMANTALAQTATAQAQKPNMQTLSYEIRHATSESSPKNRKRERLTHVLRYSRILGARTKGGVYLLSSTLDARNPFGKSDATIRGAGVDLTYRTGVYTVATLGFAMADNAEVFNDGTGPASSDGKARTLSFGMQRLMAQGPKSYLYGALNHAITQIDHDFGGRKFKDTRTTTTISALYGHQIAERTVLTVGAKALASSDRFSAHLVRHGGYANLGVVHRVGDTTVSLQGSSGLGLLSGDKQISLKIGFDY